MARRRFLFPALIVFGLTLSIASSASAHQTSLLTGNLDINTADEIVVTLNLSAHDLAVALEREVDLKRQLTLSEISAMREDAVRYLKAGISLFTDTGQCAVLANYSGTYGDEEGMTPAELVFSCPGTTEQLHMDYRLFTEIDDDHQALLQVPRAEGGSETLFYDRQTPSLSFAPPHRGGDSSLFDDLLGMIGIGMVHILEGYDHILFLLLLILAAPRLFPIIRLVTAFTLGHSLTLALAWFDVFTLPSSIVEPAILASIVLVGLDSAVRPRPIADRWILAGLFGMVHGLGFFGVLSGLANIPEGRITALVGFNLGVELGQLLIVLAVAPALYWARNRSWFPNFRRGLAGLSAIGAAVWLVSSA